MEDEPKNTYDLEDRLLNFGVRIIVLTRSLTGDCAERHIGNQLLRSGTAPLSHHGEAQAAESPADFIHKLRLSLKELRETERWLKLINRAQIVPKSEKLAPLLDETDQLIRIFVTSISTAEKRRNS
ncbi:MAG: four helix bundle protein [Luteolibacter sp.]|uniref:four helix bundle protein n=1 Tax=Luteolibacter sp. TaxID=1962973 RepID=UPI003267B6E8